MTTNLRSPDLDKLLDAQVDITAPRAGVQIQVNYVRGIVHVNIDGVCVLRVCRSPEISVEEI